MNLTIHSDYALRILLYLAENRDRRVSTLEISQAYGISRHHLVRVVQTLHSHSFVNASAGRRGGISLARDPGEINIGDVVRKTEPSFRIVECFDRKANTCPIVPVCKLQGILANALESFLRALDAYTLADVARVEGGARLSQYLSIQAAKRHSTRGAPASGKKSA